MRSDIMTEKQLSRRMKALIELAHYSTRISLHLPREFLEDEEGIFNFSEKLNENIQCLLKDGKTDMIVLPNYWNDSEIIVDIKVIQNE